MRTQLAVIDNVRAQFTGTFERFGTKNGWRGVIDKTILLTGVKDSTGRVVTDHLWFNYTKGMSSCHLQPGDTVQFEARVTDYTKGYGEHTVDYRLSYPTKVRVIERSRA